MYLSGQTDLAVSWVIGFVPRAGNSRAVARSRSIAVPAESLLVVLLSRDSSGSFSRVKLGSYTQFDLAVVDYNDTSTTRSRYVPWICRETNLLALFNPNCYL